MPVEAWSSKIHRAFPTIRGLPVEREQNGKHG
jgi:hypothetical protein